MLLIKLRTKIYRYFNNDTIGISLDETTTAEDVNDLFKIFAANVTVEEVVKDESFLARSLDKSDFHRTISYLQHPVFNSYHSETRIVRYMKFLENKDVSLVHSMIPLVIIFFSIISLYIWYVCFFANINKRLSGFLHNEVEFNNGDDALQFERFHRHTSFRSARAG